MTAPAWLKLEIVVIVVKTINEIVLFALHIILHYLIGYQKKKRRTGSNMILTLNKEQTNWLYKLLRFHDKHQSMVLDDIGESIEDDYALRNWFREVIDQLKEEKETPTEAVL
jgi:hypothetical protein